MQQFQTEGAFIAKSGRLAVWSFQERGDRMAFNVTWKGPDEATDEDMQEFMRFIERRAKKVGIEVGDLGSAYHGPTSKGGRVRAAESVEQFLEEGRMSADTYPRPKVN